MPLYSILHLFKSFINKTWCIKSKLCSWKIYVMLHIFTILLTVMILLTFCRTICDFDHHHICCLIFSLILNHMVIKRLYFLLTHSKLEHPIIDIYAKNLVIIKIFKCFYGLQTFNTHWSTVTHLLMDTHWLKKGLLPDNLNIQKYAATTTMDWKQDYLLPPMVNNA